MYFVIDRIEEDIVVCENLETKEILNIEKNKLPEDIRQGLVIKLEDDIYIIDTEKTEERRQIIHEKIKNLWK